MHKQFLFNKQFSKKKQVMKKIILFVAVVMMAGFSTTAMAQTSATIAATAAGAKLIVPMGLSVAGTLDFGSIAIVDKTKVGSVILSTTKAPTYSASLVASASAGSALDIPTYSVTGTLNSTYLITLPAAKIEVTNATDPTKKMTIDNFKSLTASSSTGDGLTGTLNASGMDNFTVGATLELAIDQIGGIYAGSFPITVDYN